MLAERRSARLRWLADVMTGWDDAEVDTLLRVLRHLRTDVVQHASTAAAPHRQLAPTLVPTHS